MKISFTIWKFHQSEISLENVDTIETMLQSRKDTQTATIIIQKYMYIWTVAIHILSVSERGPGLLRVREICRANPLTDSSVGLPRRHAVQWHINTKANFRSHDINNAGFASHLGTLPGRASTGPRLYLLPTLTLLPTGFRTLRAFTCQTCKTSLLQQTSTHLRQIMNTGVCQNVWRFNICQNVWRLNKHVLVTKGKGCWKINPP